jgi:TonB family protein
MIGVALLLALTTPVPAVQSPAPQPTAAGSWLVVGEPSTPAEAQAAWKDLQAAGIAPARLVATGLAGPRPLAFHVDEGPRQGEWTFFFEDGAAQPVGAWRLRLPTSLPYRVAAQPYCDAKTCETLTARLRALPAPPVADDGVGGLYLAWRDIIRLEPCDRLAPVRKPHPRYPEDARLDDVEGRVEVQLVHNGCGDVRDASVWRSSGHASLDAAAVAQLRHWRIAPRTPGMAGVARVGVTFRLEDEIESPAGAPTP